MTKVAYYVGGLTRETGGAFSYSVALINIALGIPSIGKVIVVHGRDNREQLEQLLQPSEKLHFVRDPVLDSRVRKFLYYLSFGLLAVYELTPSPAVRKIIRALARINPYRRFFNALPAEIIHVPYCYLPVDGCRKKMVISFHDLQELRFPEFFSSRERLYRAFLYKFSLEHCDRVVVTFRHIGADIRKYFQVPPEKVDVCLLPFHEKFGGLPEGEADHDGEILAKWKIGRGFLLYPANTWPHKNHASLLRALARLRETGFDATLVCTGNKTPHYEELQRLTGELGLSGRVIFPGLVSDAELRCLYRTAGLVVIPSLYEAGSAPLFESIKMAAPVICSRVTSLPETMGNEEFIFDPLDVETMAEKIRLGLNDDGFRARNRENLERRLHFYEAMDYRQALAACYEKIAPWS